MLAFHSDLKIKQKYLSRVMAHAEADELIQGTMWENGKGCAIGCTLNGYDHRLYETELGIPIWLAKVEDTIFEGLPKKEAMQWPQKFLAAIRPGADLEKAKAPFMIFILELVLDKFDHEKNPDVLKSIERVIELYKNNGTKEEFSAAASAAYAAYASAAACAAYAAYASAAAAAAAAASASASAYIKFADKLLHILSSIEP